MIIVQYTKQDDKYLHLEVSGHAEYAKHGEDLVCAGVSSIMFGLINMLDELNENIDIKKTKDAIIINNLTDSIKVQDYIELVMMQLKTIEKTQSNYLKIERK